MTDKDEPATRPVTLLYDREPTPVVVDVGHVIHSEQTFALMLAEASPWQKLPDGSVPATPRASLRLTPPAFFTILRAMASNWNKWSAANVGADGPRFQLVNAPPLESQEWVAEIEKDEG